MKCCIKSQIRQGEVSCWDHETGLMFLKVLSTVKHLPLKKYYIYYNKCLKFNVLEAYGAIPDSTWGTMRWPVWIVHQNHFYRLSYIKWMHIKRKDDFMLKHDRREQQLVKDPGIIKGCFWAWNIHLIDSLFSLQIRYCFIFRYWGPQQSKNLLLTCVISLCEAIGGL